MTSKEETIASSYCDRKGFQSRNNTLTLDAKRKKTIRAKSESESKEYRMDFERLDERLQVKSHLC